MYNRIQQILNERTTFLLLLALLSWCVNYFYKMSKGDHWNFRMFFLNNTMAIFIWYSVSLILPDTEREKVFVMWTAFIARDLLGLLEIYWPKIFKQKIEEKFNLIDNKDKEWQ